MFKLAMAACIPFAFLAGWLLQPARNTVFMDNPDGGVRVEFCIGSTVARIETVGGYLSISCHTERSGHEMRNAGGMLVGGIYPGYLTH